MAAAPGRKLEEFGEDESFQQRPEDRAVRLQPLRRKIPQGCEES